MTKGGDRGNQYTKEAKDQNEPLPKESDGTAGKVAREHGIGQVSVKRAEKFAKGVDEAEKAVPGTKAAQHKETRPD